MQPEWDGDHIVLLSADALRADHLSCYGYPRETTPFLDKLAEESILFENAYSASSHTREAIPALLSGQYPDVAVTDNYQRAGETVASHLSDLGFATGGFHSNPYVSRAYGFDKGFDEFYDDLHFGQNRFVALAQRALDKFRNRHYARAEEINTKSFSWINSLDKDCSFFVWNHYMDTHGPYEPIRQYLELYRDDSISGRKAQKLYRRAVKNPNSISESERKLMIDCYDAEIRYNDEKIGEYLKCLRKNEILERSLLIVTADHGDAFGEHGYFGHPRYLDEEVTRVPLLVRPPGGSRGETISTVASTLDIVPTIMSASTDKVDKWPGRSLLSLSNDDNRTIFQQARGEGEKADLRRYAARNEGNKCFCQQETTSDDVSCSNCTDDSLERELREHIESRSNRPSEKANQNAQKVDEEVERRLDALGYKE